MVGMGAYIQFANSIQRESQDFTVDYATGKFEVLVERSFECIPFEIADVKALEVRLKGKVVYAAEKNVPISDVVRFTIDDGVEIGDNEILVVANRDFLSEGLAAIKTTVLWNDIPLTEKTITAEPESEMVSGTVLFHVDADVDVADESEHKH
jgi:hypothetical protein